MPNQEQDPAAASNPLLLRARDVARLESIDLSTLWRRVRDGRHPRPIHIGTTARFVESEVHAYITGLVEHRDQQQVRQHG